jgi:predicted nucleic acid-binding protein
MRTWLLDGAILVRLLSPGGVGKREIVRMLDLPGSRFLLTDATFLGAVDRLSLEPLNDKERLCEALLTFLSIDSLSGNITLLTRAVRLFARTDIEFASAYLAAQSLEADLPILSYDKALDRIPGLKRQAPGKKD